MIEIYEKYWENRIKKFGELGDGYADKNYQDYEFNLRLKIVTKNLKNILGDISNLKILDVGCGIGRWTVFFAKLGNYVVGVDISPTMISLAKERVKKESNLYNLEFNTMSSNTLKYKNYFDLVLCITVLQHIINERDFEQSIKNIVDSVKDGGLIVIMDSLITNTNSKINYITKKIFQFIYNIFVSNKNTKNTDYKTRNQLLKIRTYDNVISTFSKFGEIEVLKVQGVCLFGRYIYRIIKNKKFNNLIKKICFLLDYYTAGWSCFNDLSQPVLIIIKIKK